MTTQDVIWNRSLGFGGPRGNGVGDEALANLLRLHSLAQNSGLLSTVESLSESEVSAAIDGYRWMGLESAANVISSVQKEMSDGALDNEDRAEALELRADEDYSAAVPRDFTLVAALEAKLTENPAWFQGL